MLIAKNLFFDRGSKSVLQDISLSISAGQMVGVLGPNGSGKTTLMRLFAGELKPKQGKIILDNVCMNDWSGFERAQRIAVLSQNIQMAFDFSVSQVIEMGNSHNKHPSNMTAIDRNNLLSQLSIQSLIHKSYQELSGGEKLRVQLARVVTQILPPREGTFLLLDEPTAALDLNHQHQSLQYLQTLTKFGVGVMMSIHDLNLAAQYCDFLWVLKNGEVVAEGPTESTFNAEMFHKTFDIQAHVFNSEKNTPAYFLYKSSE